jgi:hypothetical protein
MFQRTEAKDIFGYQCQTCGEYHEGVSSFGWEYPMVYLGGPEEERADRVLLTSDSCVIDDK